MKKNTFINLVFNKKGGDSRAVLDYTSDISNWNVDMYNCILKGMGTEYSIAFFCQAGGYCGKAGKMDLYNCLILNTGNLTNSPHQGYTGKIVNCASIAEVANSGLVELTNTISNIAVDENYNITSDGWKNVGTGTNPDGSRANLGVYGGEYSWEN